MLDLLDALFFLVVAYCCACALAVCGRRDDARALLREAVAHLDGLEED